MQKRDYSRVLCEIRDLPEDIGRLISQYKTPGEVIVELLNLLGPHYSTGLGINPDDYVNSILHPLETLFTSETYNLYLNLSTDGLVHIGDVAYRLTYDTYQKKCSDRSYYLFLDVTKLKAIADTPIVDKNFISLKFQQNREYQHDSIWWNSKDSYVNEYRLLSRQFVLPNLSSRSYIHVIDPFINVVINAKEKDSLITIDDILFATRALAKSAHVEYKNFKILDETYHTLALEPEFEILR